jgi:hypothetical protein
LYTENNLQALVDSKMVFSEDLGPCIPTWKDPSRTLGYKWGLLKVRKGNTNGAWWVQVESTSRESGLCFSGAFKTYTNPWGGHTQKIPTQ